jgi:DNA-binding response OmpR family regulator
MKPLRSFRRSVLPVLYVGAGLTSAAYETLRTRRIGVVLAEDASRARRMLSHFRVAAIVFDAPDLPGLSQLKNIGTPVIVLAARDAVCDLDAVTIVRRETDSEELAAIIHGVVRDLTPEAVRDAA